MPAAFRQTLSALGAETRRRHRTLLILIVVSGLLLVWLLWFFLAALPLYAVSERARLQATQEVHPIDVLVAGRVISVNLPLGGEVKAGDPLIVLDTADIELRLAESQARSEGLSAQVQALEAEISARKQALAETEKVGQASLSEAMALREQSQVVAGLAAKEGTRTEQLHQAGVVPESERDRARAGLAEKRAQAAARTRRLGVVATQSRLDIAERRAETASLERTLAALRAERAGVIAQVARLEQERALHIVRAPVSGSLGDVRAPQIGSAVEIGQTVAVVTPQGGLRIAADFVPVEAVGRIRPGQPARMRVSGFSWTQYGMLHARVSAVSSEVMDGRIRVELALDSDQSTEIPLGHGLTGTVEIELEEVSPATLIVRAAGDVMTGRRLE